MMDVAAVGGEKGLAAQEPANHDQRGIEQGDEEDQERSGHAQDSGGFLAPKDAVAAEQETEKEAAGITEKDGGGIEVVAQESEEGADQGHGGEGERNVGLEERGEEHGGGGEEPEAGSEAIDAINKVESVGAEDEPPNGEEEAPAGPEAISGETRQMNAGPEGAGGARDLAKEFLPGAEAAYVIEQSDGEDDDGRRQETPSQGHAGCDDASGVEGQGQQDDIREEVGQGHHHAAAVGDGPAVQLMSNIRTINEPPVTESIPDQRGEKERQEEGRKAQENQGIHG
jgi:hypothetical protein